MQNEKNLFVVLAILAVVGVLSAFLSGTFVATLLAMFLYYLSNVSYSFVSRSGVRNSALYHGITVLISNFLFYSVLHTLVSSNLSLIFFIPYTVATVFGSFTGATLSMKIEHLFGITTNMDKNAKPTAQSYLAKRILLVLVGVLAVWFAFTAENLWVALSIAGLMFLNDSIFSLLRRARNSSNVPFHIVVSLLQSVAWFLLYRNLSTNQLAFTLFPAYCFGSVMGNLFGQELSGRIEKMLHASADKHLTSDTTNFIPWKEIGILAVIGIVFIVLYPDVIAVLWIIGLALLQQISFSVVSRSRQRSSMLYHVIASIFSNSVWFMTFRQIQTNDWSFGLFIPYATGTAIGSITGVGISMGIEKKIGAVSDVAPQKASA